MLVLELKDKLTNCKFQRRKDEQIDFIEKLQTNKAWKDKRIELFSIVSLQL